uniref:Putative secreted peptide n=1 Tax=Anopheles braziliensis TaxID=58242 RepID=A0A2M3ZTC3_9DIPT
MGRTVQLPLPAGGLLGQPARATDGPDLLVVLHLEIHRVLRHAVLHPTEEDAARLNPARHPPWLHAVLGVDGHEVCTRWSQYVLRDA